MTTPRLPRVQFSKEEAEKGTRYECSEETCESACWLPGQLAIERENKRNFLIELISEEAGVDIKKKNESAIYHLPHYYELITYK